MLASLKLIDLVESNAAEIAKNWAIEVKRNKRTLHYHKLPEGKLVPEAIEFYTHLRKILMSAHAYQEGQEYFFQYAKNSYEEGIPLHEAIYALVLMRRQMWLFAEFQATFITIVEHQQAIDSISRTILVIDYAIYRITQHYMKLMKKG